MRKSELRKLYKNKRETLTEQQIEQYSIAIANQTLKVDGLWDHQNYHIFLSIDRQKEVNTEFLLSVLQGKDKNVLLSKSNFKQGTLTHYLLTDSTIIKINKYGIPEPEQGIQMPADQVEVVFIPLLAYDRKGNRIGYGKGFYDRFLAECRLDILKIGLSFYPAEDEIISDINTDDIPLDYCITPENVFKF
ncbi:5-formyltetrahydrofolate cyclo-ligase [Galbibacter sp.]|uniref:5-formyltetrahydrofolate cyclo-ligase n=1 Tax=Galbibacter sp. TaxID=2918471 RepID=UPI003A8CB53B